MSGECDKCGEHALECKCPIVRERKWISKEEAFQHFPVSNDDGLTVQFKQCAGIESMQKAFDECEKPFDEGHHCKKGSFVCFRLMGELELTLDAPKNVPVIVFACPFCGKTE